MTTVFMCRGCFQLTQPHNLALGMMLDDGSDEAAVAIVRAMVTLCCRKGWMRVRFHEHIDALALNSTAADMVREGDAL